MTVSVWDTLGIERTRDQKEIKRAYARKLKETNPEDDPEGFKTLRAAYERALAGTDDHSDAIFVFPTVTKPEKVQARPPAARDDVPAEPASPDPRQIHAGLQGRLENLLRKRQAEPEAVLAAFQAVLTSPAMELVDVHGATEEWLAWLIANRSPRSDVLITPARDRFGWGGRSLRQRDHYHVQRILARQRDLAFLGEIRKRDSSHNPAYRVLTAPPKPLTVWRRLLAPVAETDIADLLNLIRREHPTLIDDLNVESVALWGTHFAQPRLGTWSLRLTVVSPVLLAGAVLGWFVAPPDWRGLFVLMCLPSAFALMAVLGVYGSRLQQHLWRKFFAYGAPLWARYGWAPTLLAVLGAAALPAYPILTIAIAAAAATTGFWAWTTGQPDRSDGQMPWQFRAAFSEFYLTAWWLVTAFNLTDLMAFLQMSAVLIAAVVVSAWGQRPLFELWLSWPIWGRLVYGAGALAAVGGAAFLLYSSAVNQNAAWWPGVVAAVAGVVLMHRPLTPMLGAWSFRLKWYSMLGLFWAALHGGGSYVVIAGAGLLLFWAAAHTIVATVRGTSSRG